MQDILFLSGGTWGVLTVFVRSVCLPIKTNLPSTEFLLNLEKDRQHRLSHLYTKAISSPAFTREMLGQISEEQVENLPCDCELCN